MVLSSERWIQFGSGSRLVKYSGSLKGKFTQIAKQMVWVLVLQAFRYIYSVICQLSD